MTSLSDYCVLAHPDDASLLCIPYSSVSISPCHSRRISELVTNS
jgi:hypothetical protein